MSKCRKTFKDPNLRNLHKQPFASPAGYAVLHSKYDVEIGAKAGLWTGSRLAYLCNALPKLIYFAEKQGKLDSMQH